MSKDSSPTYIHLHQPRLADLFEDFNRPHSSLTANPSSSATAAGSHASALPAMPLTTPASPTSLPPSFLPVEDIYVAPQYQPVNPEDEDDVVPDQHAAFGITRAMDARRSIVWRDLGLEELMRGVRLDVERDGGRRGRAARTAVWARLGRRVACLR